MKLISVFLSVFPAALGICLAQAPNSAWVYPSATGNLLYQLDERGQRIADFSQCGYRGGTEPLPNVAALIPESRWVRVSPGAGDDTALIQAAIDSVEAMTPDADGWRGVVYLNAGEYQLAETITIAAGGVVLKGEGDDSISGTRLRATGTNPYDLISVNGSGSRTTVSDTTRNFIQKLVPAGARTFEVDSTNGLAVGHTVIVKRPSTANWIADIDMDQLGPTPDVVPWSAGSKDLLFDRTITRIEGNRITVDAPLPQTFESQYGGGQIWRYTWSSRMQQVGIEDLYAFSDYASPTDENHAWNFITMSRVQHGWVRNITAQYFGLSAVWLGAGGKWITVADSQCLDPISIIDGGRRYPFQNTGSELTLFVNNHARNGRHDFSFGALVPGPNAFVHGTADSAKSDTGPHQRWAVGGLFDLITINGNEINVQNRGNSGSGHGWAGAYMAVWNCKANGFRVRNPPTACNWLVGSIGTISASQAPVGVDPPGTYDSSGPSGTGKAVYPRSLYYGQLQQRLKWPGSEFREVWLGDVDQHTNDGASDTVNCDAAWLAQVEAIESAPADANFDSLAGNRHTACTLDFSLDPGDTIVAASLTVSLRGIGSADSDSIWLDSTASPQTYASLGWTPISTTGPTVRTMEVSPELLADGRLNLAFGTNSAVDFVVLHLQVQKAQAPTRTMTLTPVADAYVRGSATYANTNFGNDPSLQTKDITVSSVNRETFLRWDLSGVSGKILQARVRLAGTASSQTGNESCATFVSDDSWDESTLTFNNKPSAGKLFAQWLPVTGQPVEFIVTPQVLDTLLGDGQLSLRLASTDNFGASGNVTYASRENPTVANRPQLILTLEDAAPTITSIADQTVNENTATPSLPVVLGDDYTEVASLTLTGTSSNPTLVPDANIVFGGSGANRTVTVTPASNQNGTATITLAVSDGALITNTTFLLTVTGMNDTMIKAATGDALNLGAAWTGGIVPMDPDTATWNATSLTGTMTLGADQNWGGIIITNPAAPITFNGTQTLTLGSAGIDLSAATVDLTLDHPVVLGENQPWNVGVGRTLAANGVISGPGSLTKTGAGNLTFSAVGSYTGTTTIDQGTLAFTTTSPSLTGGLIFGASAGSTNTGTLDLSAASATFSRLVVQTNNSAANNTISIGSGRTLTLTGSTVANVLHVGSSAAGRARLLVTGATSGVGTLAVVDATRNLVVASTEASNTATTSQTMNLSGLDTFNASIANLYIGRPTTAAGAATSGRAINDALTLAGDNAITASGTNGIVVGGSSTTGTSISTPAKLILGTTNVLNTDQFVIGNGRVSGTLQFNSGLTNSTITLRGAAGGNTRTDIHLGDQGVTRPGISSGGGGSTNNLGVMDLTGGSVDARIGSLLVGLGSGPSTSRAAGNGNFIMNGATSMVDINTLVIAQNVNANSIGNGTVSTGTFTMNNGTLQVNTAAILANDIDTTATTDGIENLTATFNVAGGTATVGSLGNPVNLILGNHVNAGNPGLATASVGLTGGTLNVFGDIKEGNLGAGTITSSLTLNGATLDMKGNSIGTSGAPIDTLTFASGTLRNVAAINGTGGLTKTTAGTLLLEGSHGFTGATTVNGGMLSLSGSLAGPLTVNAGTFAPQGLPVAGGAVSVNAGGIFQARINGPTAGTQYDQLAAGDSVTLGGTLDLAAGPGLAMGAIFKILNKTSPGAISGTFSDRPEGGVFSDDGYTWRITYLGGDGNDVVLTLENGATPTYASWIDGFFPGETNPAIIGTNADPDKDGIASAVEMVLGGNPKLVMDTVLLPTLARVTDPAGIPAGDYLLFTYRRSDISLAAGILTECETSTGLATPWTPAAAITDVVIRVDDNFTFIPPAAADTDWVRVYVPRGSDPVCFCRLKVIIP